MKVETKQMIACSSIRFFWWKPWNSNLRAEITSSTHLLNPTNLFGIFISSATIEPSPALKHTKGLCHNKMCSNKIAIHNTPKLYRKYCIITLVSTWGTYHLHGKTRYSQCSWNLEIDQSGGRVGGGGGGSYMPHGILMVWVKILRYRKIPKISPGAFIFQRPFFEGLIFGELTFRGAHLWR